MTPVVKAVDLSDQVTLPYVEQGDPMGPSVVFLHAIADSWHSFERVLSHLPGSIHAIAPTQRGHGDASRPTAGYRSRDFAADLAAFMNAIDLDAAILVGGSSAGFIARRFAIDHPERTLGLVLLGSPASLYDKPGVQDMWDSTMSELVDPIDPGFVRDFAESALAQPVPQTFLETIVQENLKVPARVWRETFRGLLEERLSEEVNTIRAPTLIMWGDQDSILPRSDQEALASAIPGSRLVVYTGAGHAFYWEEPERVASDLAGFVEGLTT